jgi:hypothetical protein
MTFPSARAKRALGALDDFLRRLDAHVGKIDHARHDLLAGEILEHRAVGEFRPEGVARGTLVVGVTSRRVSPSVMMSS